MFTTLIKNDGNRKNMNQTSNPKKEQILRTGKDLFWKFGIKRVTIEEICREAGVSKMTFYKYFSNKIDLAVHIFRQLYDEYYEYFDHLFASDILFEEKLAGLIKAKLEAAENMSLEIVHDLYRSDIPALKEVFEQQQKRFLSLTLDFIRQGKKEGYIRHTLSNDFILFQINRMAEMIRSDELLALYDNTQVLTRDLLDYFFYGILTGEK